MKHLSNWIEFPVSNMERATQFYEKLLGIELLPLQQAEHQYALFPARNRYNTGALVCGPGYEPGPQAPLVYLNAQDQMDEILARLEAAGGQLLMPKTLLSEEAGEVALFLDSEGNRVGLQSSLPATEFRSLDAQLQRALSTREPLTAFLLRPGPRYGAADGEALQWEHAKNMLRGLQSGQLVSVTALFPCAAEAKDKAESPGKLSSKDSGPAPQSTEGAPETGFGGPELLGLGLSRLSPQLTAELLRQDPAVRGGRFSFELMSGLSFSADEGYS